MSELNWNGLEEKCSSLKTTVASRKEDIATTLDKVDDFFDAHSALTSELGRVTDQLTTKRPITSQALIAQEIEDMKVNNIYVTLILSRFRNFMSSNFAPFL